MKGKKCYKNNKTVATAIKSKINRINEAKINKNNNKNKLIVRVKAKKIHIKCDTYIFKAIALY